MPEPMLTASVMFANAARCADAYHTAIAPLCASTGLPPAAADILLFLANNPGCETAGEICRMRGMKPALVSFHIDRLVGEGYLLRLPVPGDPGHRVALRAAPGRQGLQQLLRIRIRHHPVDGFKPLCLVVDVFQLHQGIAGGVI